VSTGLALLGIVAAVSSLLGLAWLARDRRSTQRSRRLATLAAVAERVDAALASLPEPRPAKSLEPAPKPSPANSSARVRDVPGRTELVDGLQRAVTEARENDSRLSVAVVEASEDLDARRGRELGETAGTPVYVVGPRSIALVLPGFGRAAALGVLARIQATHGMPGRVAELQPDETAVELAARLLSSETS
jgi:hypothetical protein